MQAADEFDLFAKSVAIAYLPSSYPIGDHNDSLAFGLSHKILGDRVVVKLS
jgi:hypothetical protein